LLNQSNGSKVERDVYTHPLTQDGDLISLYFLKKGKYAIKKILILTRKLFFQV